MCVKIRLSYWDGINLGDALSPFIVSELSGEKVSHFNSDTDLSIGSLWRKIYQAIKHGSLREVCYAFGCFHKNIMAIGSMLEHANKNTIVWGSGFIAPNGICKTKRIRAVRGKCTVSQLKSLGYDTSKVVLGDPALLLPLVIKPSETQTRFIGIIPHWREIENFISMYGDEHVIDIRTTDIKHFVNEVTSCKHILASSLHGLIIAHAYGIPALLIEKKKEKEFGYFKYDDYFSSVNIESGKCVSIDGNLLNNHQRLESLFEEYAKNALPQVDICAMQIALLNAAPFPLKEEYRQICSPQKL